jgi:signal transduction histidine kinase
MDDPTLPATRSRFIRTILIGHLINIVISLAIFCVLHWVVKLETSYSIGAVVFSATLVSVATSLFAAKKIHQPYRQISQELDTLHEQVVTSHAAYQAESKNNNALINRLPIGFALINTTSQTVTTSGNVADLLGITSDTIQASTLLKTLDSCKSNGAAINFNQWLSTLKTKDGHEYKVWPGVVFENQKDIVTLTGVKQTTACTLVAHYNQQDKDGNDLALVFIDSTDEYNLQDKQMEFVALAAHELRGPITILRGLIDILTGELDEATKKKQETLLTRLVVSSRQLSGYVDNILSVSKIDRDSFELQLNEAKWDQIIDIVSPDLTVRARAHKRTVSFSIPKNLPTVAVDSGMIAHVLNNLVDNAIKYSNENGQITVTSSSKNGYIETTIHDTGIGIPSSVVGNLFTKFYRSHRSKQAVNGTGLGLYLCKAIVDAHGGSIWVKSTEGAGSTFGFTVPEFSTVADKVKSDNNKMGILRGSHGWIKNHAMYRR